VAQLEVPDDEEILERGMLGESRMGVLCSFCEPVGSAFAGSNPAPTT
jgi:hypothetical protein